jgi:hypothetical protein
VQTAQNAVGSKNLPGEFAGNSEDIARSGGGQDSSDARVILAIMSIASLSTALLATLARLSPSSRLSFDASLIAVFVVGFGLIGGLLAVSVFGEWRARRRAAALRRAVEGKIGPLAAGECVLRGVIETDDPDGRAIAIELLQSGHTQQMKNGPQQVWQETARRVDARPFYLRLEDGRSVRVEPDQRVFVVDALDGTRRTEFNQRVRTAEVRRGDSVFVIGSLTEGFDPHAQIESGYRGAKSKSLVLRAPARRSMLVSTEVPTERHVRREGFHGNWALAFGVVFLLVHGLAFGRFHLLTLSGTNVQATVADRTQQYHRTKNGGYYSYHLAARYENVSGHTVSVTDEVSRDAFSDSETEPGQRVPFVVSTFSAGVAQVGTSPGISTFACLMSGFFTLLLAVAYGVSITSTRPWYERKRVTEYAPGAVH